MICLASCGHSPRFFDEDVINGVAADDFTDGRDDDVAQHFFGLVRLEEVVFRVADAVLHGGADFDDVFVRWSAFGRCAGRWC